MAERPVPTAAAEAPSRKPSLIERMTGKRKLKKPARDRRESPPAAAIETEPLFPADTEESDLDIPAFLIRQAN